MMEEATLKMGIMPSADQLAAMGLTNQQAKSYIAASQIQASAKGVSGGATSTTGSGAGVHTGSGDIYQAMFDSGIENEGQAYNYLLKQGFNSTDAKRIAEYYTGMLEDDAFKKEPQFDETGLNNSYFNAGMSSMRTSLQQGRIEGALSGLESMWPKLNDSQKEKVQTLLAEYGLSYQEG